MNMFHFSDMEYMKESHKKWVAEALNHDHLNRQSLWTQSIAVGDKAFLESVKDSLKYQAKGRDVVEAETGHYQLREIQEPYDEHTLTGTTSRNTYLWR